MMANQLNASLRNSPMVTTDRYNASSRAAAVRKKALTPESARWRFRTSLITLVSTKNTRGIAEAGEWRRRTRSVRGPGPKRRRWQFRPGLRDCTRSMAGTCPAAPESRRRAVGSTWREVAGFVGQGGPSWAGLATFVAPHSSPSPSRPKAPARWRTAAGCSVRFCAPLKTLVPLNPNLCSAQFRR